MKRITFSFYNWPTTRARADLRSECISGLSCSHSRARSQFKSYLVLYSSLTRTAKFNDLLERKRESQMRQQVNTRYTMIWAHTSCACLSNSNLKLVAFLFFLLFLFNQLLAFLFLFLFADQTKSNQMKPKPFFSSFFSN